MLKFFSEQIEEGDEVNFFLTLMRTIFTNVSDLLATALRTSNKISEDDLKRVETAEIEVEFLTDMVKFLQLLDGAIKGMKELLESASLLEMQEAVDFFVAAYHFKLDNAVTGVLGMYNL